MTTTNGDKPLGEITMREFYAAKALEGLLASGNSIDDLGPDARSDFADLAFALAEAMCRRAARHTGG